MTFDEARNAMLAIVKGVADTETITLVYPDVPGSVPTGNVVWARPNVLHATGRQGSLTGAHGTVRYERTGTLWIQLFAPTGDGNTAGYAKAQALVNAIQAYRGEIWFRDAHMEEMGADGSFQRFDVKTTFQYEDVR